MSAAAWGAALAAELRKLVTLPATWIAAAVGVVGAVGLAVFNGVTVRSAHISGRAGQVADGTAFDTAMMPSILVVSVAAVVIGVTAMSSEYARSSPDAGGTRQVTTTLLVMPSRALVLVAKAVAVTVVVAGVAWLAVGLSVAAASLAMGPWAVGRVTLGDGLTRVLGGTLYWVLLAWIALAIATLARTGLVPLILLIVNSAVVPLSLLLFHVTRAARWLPDLAGQGLFRLPPENVIPGLLPARTGGMVMAAWSVALVVVAGISLERRDA